MMNTKNILMPLVLLTALTSTVHASESNPVPLRQIFEHFIGVRYSHYGDDKTEADCYNNYCALLRANRHTDLGLRAALLLQLGDIAFHDERAPEAITFLTAGLELHDHLDTHKSEFGLGCVNLITLYVDKATSNNKLPDDIRANYEKDARKWARVLRETYKLDKNYATPDTMRDLRDQLARLK